MYDILSRAREGVMLSLYARGECANKCLIVLMTACARVYIQCTVNHRAINHARPGKVRGSSARIYKCGVYCDCSARILLGDDCCCLQSRQVQY